jgi:hypothetical protein
MGYGVGVLATGEGDERVMRTSHFLTSTQQGFARPRKSTSSGRTERTVSTFKNVWKSAYAEQFRRTDDVLYPQTS